MIEIKICLGTTCFIMGSSDIAEQIEETFDKETLSNIKIRFSHCLGECSNGKHGKAPYVLVGDTLIEQANLEKIKKELSKLSLGDN